MRDTAFAERSLEDNGGVELQLGVAFERMPTHRARPFAKEVDVYAHNVQNAQGTDLPVLKYTLPVVTGNAALVLYF